MKFDSFIAKANRIRDGNKLVYIVFVSELLDSILSDVQKWAGHKIGDLNYIEWTFSNVLSFSWYGIIADFAQNNKKND